MKFEHILVVFFSLRHVCLANTISQFVRPFSGEIFDTSTLLPTSKAYNVTVAYSDEIKLNEFYLFVPATNLSAHGYETVNVIFENVPLKNEFGALANSFFSKICWTPVSSVDLQDLTFYISKESNAVVVQFAAHPLNDKVDGFTFYISLEKVLFGLLPFSLIYLVGFLAGFIVILGSVLYVSYPNLLQVVLLEPKEDKSRKLKEE